MAVFLHFGKEISDMMVKHISIEVTSKQTKSLFSVVRRILLLIFWNRWMVFWIKRGRLCCFAQAADTVHFLPEKTSPSL